MVEEFRQNYKIVLLLNWAAKPEFLIYDNMNKLKLFQLELLYYSKRGVLTSRIVEQRQNSFTYT